MKKYDVYVPVHACVRIKVEVDLEDPKVKEELFNEYGDDLKDYLLQKSHDEYQGISEVMGKYRTYTTNREEDSLEIMELNYDGKVQIYDEDNGLIDD